MPLPDPTTGTGSQPTDDRPDLQTDGGHLQSAVLIRFFMPLIIGVILAMVFAFLMLMMNADVGR